MSKVSLKNELLPSFEPIEQQKTSIQKRKRTLRDSTPIKNEQPISHKRSRAKKNSSASAAIANSVVWIGATLMQGDIKTEQVSSSITAAYSVYYGLNDGRNFTEKVSIKQNQGLDHVYIMGAIRALEKCEDDSTSLSIHTGSRVLQSAIDQGKQDDSAICDEIKEKIAKRKGSTSISYKSSTDTSNKEDEYQVAHKMATEKLFELEETQEDGMDIDDKQVESPEVAHIENSDIKKVSVTFATTEEIKVEEDDGSKVIEKEEVVYRAAVTEEKACISETGVPMETVAAPSWASTLNLRNLLDILKAPFTRKS